jgi:hypothetical protein
MAPGRPRRSAHTRPTPRGDVALIVVARRHHGGHPGTLLQRESPMRTGLNQREPAASIFTRPACARNIMLDSWIRTHARADQWASEVFGAVALSSSPAMISCRTSVLHRYGEPHRTVQPVDRMVGEHPAALPVTERPHRPHAGGLWRRPCHRGLNRDPVAACLFPAAR